MKRTDDQIRRQFFKELSAAERLKVLRVFLDIPDAAAAEVNSHSIEAKLLSVVLRPAARVSGVELPFPALPANAWDRFQSLRKILHTPGYCAGTKYTEREAFDMATAAPGAATESGGET